MSRSLRSRPLTLYDANTSSIPPVPSASPQDASYYPQQQSPHSISPATPSASAKSRLKKASQVGSNLKKRLSTRYGNADDDSPRSGDRRSRVTPREDVPAVPSLPSSAQSQARLPTLGSGLEGYNLEEEDEEDEQHFQPPPSTGGYLQSSELASSSASSMMQPSSSVMQHMTVPTLQQRSTSRQPAQSQSQSHSHSSSSRKPTLAWEGSSLRETLQSAYAQGLDSVVDLDSLRRQHDQFDGTDYLRLHMVDGVSASMFSSTLNAAKEALRTDVKSQAFDHYADFIAISSQIGALENEMIELKSLLAEWRGMPRVLEREDENGRGNTSAAGVLLSTAQSKRNSLLSLQQVYRAQLTSLWEGISNSQKFIPYKPGRHLIAEASDFVELNAATYRPTKNVALFLLDDLLLIAARKKGKMSTKVQLEAERCFALGDIVVVDLKDSSSGGTTGGTSADSGTSVLNSIKIKRGKETFVYRAERVESKKALLAAFRRVAEDLANRRKRGGGGGGGVGSLDVVDTSSGAGGRRMSVYAGVIDKGGPSPASTPSLLGSLAEDEDGDQDGQGVMKIATERIKEERKDPHRWMNDWSDALAVDIALRRWSSACEKVLKGKAVLSTYQPTDPIHTTITHHISTHTSSLVSSLLHSIQSPTLRKTTLTQLSQHLTTLGYSSVARQTFLSSRSETLRRRKRSIKFEGDVELYVSELSMVVFGMVRNTSEWFMSSWKEVGMASGFVKWALSEVHSFALGFKRQVFGSFQEQQVDDDMVKRAKSVAMESAKQLRDVGLDFGFVLDELLKSPAERRGRLESNKSATGTNTSGVASRIAAFQGGTNNTSTTIQRRPSLSSSSSRQRTQIPPPPVPPIPSLTLTLADEASGISHRISSADLPAVTAQEIRRRSRVER